MLGTLTQWLAEFGDVRQRNGIRNWALPIVDKTSSQALQSAGMLISSGGATTAKTGSSDTYCVVQGTLVKIPASTTLPVLTGINAAQNAFQVALFYVDVAGTRTVLGGTANATLGLVTFPQSPQGKALFGMLIITNTGGVFTGGTTALDTATTVYINIIGDVDPTVLV